MSPRRYINSDIDDATPSEVLGEKLTFNSGRSAQNRFLKAALSELLSTFEPENLPKHGLPTQTILNIYDKWGNGKFGVILTGNVVVDPTHLEAAGNPIIFKEGDTEERRALFKQYAKNIKQDGALAVMQLSHGGRQTPETIQPHPFSASDVRLEKSLGFTTFGQPIPLTLEQIETEVIDRFVYAAKYAYESGFDGVELHGAHGYLLSQFSSQTTNKRDDKYGGPVENRIRIVLEIYDAIRKAVPSPSFIIGIKTNSVEFQAEGTTVETAKEICTIFEKKGFDFVELSGGTYEQFGFQHSKESTKKREAFFLEFAEKIRPVFKNTVVYLTGGFRTVKGMVSAIQSNATQGIGLGRPITAEPDLPKKILTGKVESALYNDLEQTDYVLASLQSTTQMEQMGRTTIQQANNDPSFGISDFSNLETLERFKSKIGGYVKSLKLQAEQGKPRRGVLIFD